MKKPSQQEIDEHEGRIAAALGRIDDAVYRIRGATIEPFMPAFPKVRFFDRPDVVSFLIVVGILGSALAVFLFG